MSGGFLQSNKIEQLCDSNYAHKICSYHDAGYWRFLRKWWIGPAIEAAAFDVMQHFYEDCAHIDPENESFIFITSYNALFVPVVLEIQTIQRRNHDFSKGVAQTDAQTRGGSCM